MHPVLADRRRLALYLAAWCLAAALLSAPLGRADGAGAGETLAIALPLAILLAFLSLAAWYPCRAFPLGRTPLARVLAVHALAAAVSSAAAVWTGWQVAVLLSSAPRFEYAAARWARHAPFLLALGAVVSLLSSALHYLFVAVQDSRAAEERALRMELQAREAELRSLRSQVDPHFLFNCLNSIAGLAGSDPEGARRMCVLLAGFLRRSLELGSRDRIPLADEVALARDYLAIEQVRSGAARLRIETWIEGATGRCPVPPLLLQPLVENAVKHGIAGLVGGGAIRIEARFAHGRLVVRIRNPRDPDNLPRPGTGVGIENVRRRIETAFGSEGRLEIRPGRDEFEAVLVLPREDLLEADR